VEEAIHKRRMGQAVRLQHEARTPAGVLGLLREELRLDLEDVFAAEGYIALTDLSQLYAQIDIPKLKDTPWPPAPVPELAMEEDIFSSIRRQDILLHHPYQDFSVVNRFIAEAAEDPSVLAIKMTLYRTSGDSRIAQALQAAARNGKQVAVLVELRARFNEESNIAWARRLEAAGAHVVYGIVGYKTHCKAALVVRKEVGGLRRYVHLSTGNYNESTARYYTDFGLLTCRESFAEDIGRLFNLLTGYAPADDLNHMLIAPTGMKDGFLAKIRREIANARAGRPSGIRAKLNALTDREIIEALYEAGRAGVPVRLIVRGICALKPSLSGVSDNIEAISIIDRYLEHARIYAFENDGDPEYWLSSADWMSRNLNGRIEVAFPILDDPLKARLEETLQIQFSDNCKVRVLLPDSNSVRRASGGEPMRAQERLMAAAWKWSEKAL
jgi:polyphosphate kinase